MDAREGRKGGRHLINSELKESGIIRQSNQIQSNA